MKSDFKVLAKELLILVLVILFLSFTVNCFSPNKITLFAKKNDFIKKTDVSVNKNIQILNLSDTKKIFEEKSAVFVDARPKSQYIEGHIQGAVNIPVYVFYDYIENFMLNHNETTPIITYCSSKNCTDSSMLAQYFFDMDYKNIKIFIDGFDKWEEKGYKIETSNQ